MHELCRELENVWHAGIPLAAAMRIEVIDFEGDRLRVRAPLAPNVNMHGSAFAGSLYGVCVLAGWGAIWLRLRQRGLEGSILLAAAHIDYLRPVVDAIECVCDFDTASHARQLERVAASGKGVFELATRVLVADQEAARFEGRYAVRARALPG